MKKILLLLAIISLGLASCGMPEKTQEKVTQDIMTETEEKEDLFGTAEYEWSKDFSTCTATLECYNDSSKTIVETVETTSEIIREANYYQDGEIVYTAVFTNECFETQTFSVLTPVANVFKTFDDNGNLIEYKYIDSDEFGVIQSSFVEKYQYNEQGKCIYKETLYFDGNEELTKKDTMEFEYDKDGKVINTVQCSYLANGMLISKSINDVIYISHGVSCDENDNIVGYYIYESYYDEDMNLIYEIFTEYDTEYNIELKGLQYPNSNSYIVLFRETYTEIIDEFGVKFINYYKETFDFDTNSRVELTIVYDSNDKKISETLTTTKDEENLFEQTIDRIIYDKNEKVDLHTLVIKNETNSARTETNKLYLSDGTLIDQSYTEEKFDENGVHISSTYITYDEIGVLRSKEVITYEYDENGEYSLVTRTLENKDRVIFISENDHVLYEYFYMYEDEKIIGYKVIENTYDENYNRLTEKETEYTLDDEVFSKFVIEYTYDKDNNMLTKVECHYLGEILQGKHVTTNTYKGGLLTKTVEESFDPNDNLLNSKTTENKYVSNSSVLDTITITIIEGESLQWRSIMVQKPIDDDKYVLISYKRYELEVELESSEYQYNDKYDMIYSSETRLVLDKYETTNTTYVYTYDELDRITLSTARVVYHNGSVRIIETEYDYTEENPYKSKTTQKTEDGMLYEVEYAIHFNYFSYSTERYEYKNGKLNAKVVYHLEMNENECLYKGYTRYSYDENGNVVDTQYYEA